MNCLSGTELNTERLFVKYVCLKHYSEAFYFSKSFGNKAQVNGSKFCVAHKAQPVKRTGLYTAVLAPRYEGVHFSDSRQPFDGGLQTAHISYF